MGDKLFMIYITHIVPGIYDYQLFLHPFGIIKMPFITASPFLEAGWVIMKHSCFSGLHNNSSQCKDSGILLKHVIFIGHCLRSRVSVVESHFLGSLQDPTQGPTNLLKTGQ